MVQLIKFLEIMIEVTFLKLNKKDFLPNTLAKVSKQIEKLAADTNIF